MARTGWAIGGPTKLPEEAWALVAMVASREGELDEVKIGQTTPSRVSVATSKEYLDPTQPPKNVKAFADGQEFVVRDPLHPKWADVERDVVDKTLNEQLWTNLQPASQAAATIKAQGDPQLKGQHRRHLNSRRRGPTSPSSALPPRSGGCCPPRTRQCRPPHRR